MHVLIALRYSPRIRAVTTRFDAAVDLAAAIEDEIPGLTIDYTFPAVAVPRPITDDGSLPQSLLRPVTFSTAPEASTYVIRGTIPDFDAQRASLASAAAHPDIVAVFADPLVEASPAWGEGPPAGSASDVQRQLGVDALRTAGLDGSDVPVAIVDTGINAAYLRALGHGPRIDETASFRPEGVVARAGEHPVDHGTMCAFDVGIAAPSARLLDCAVLRSRAHAGASATGLLSDALLAYSRLREMLVAIPLEARRLVISNSWGLYAHESDFPVGHQGNYSDSPGHPFNVIVAALEEAGADVVFAADACGANSHPGVLSIAGVDVLKRRVGHSSQGPGRLAGQKPDLSGYTHFAGSGVYPADSGTSAACPIVAGVVAAIRQQYPVSILSPRQLRALMCRTSEDLDGRGFDFAVGWGVVDVTSLLRALARL